MTCNSVSGGGRLLASGLPPAKTADPHQRFSEAWRPPRMLRTLADRARPVIGGGLNEDKPIAGDCRRSQSTL